MATKATKKETPLTIGDASSKLDYFIHTLFLNKIKFTLMNKPANKCFVITAVEGCHAMKHIIPQTEIETNSRMEPYAQLIINYE